MFKPISIKFTWTKALAVKASKLYYDYDMRHSTKRYVGWLFIALTQFGIVGALKHDAYGILLISTFLVIYWYYVRWYLRKAMIIKYYDKSVHAGKKIEFILEGDGLHHDDQHITWDEIVKVIKFDDGVLLQTQDNTLFFNKEAFSSYDEFQRFISLMKEKGKM